MQKSIFVATSAKTFPDTFTRYFIFLTPNACLERSEFTQNIY